MITATPRIIEHMIQYRNGQHNYGWAHDVPAAPWLGQTSVDAPIPTHLQTVLQRAIAAQQQIQVTDGTTTVTLTPLITAIRLVALPDGSYQVVGNVAWLKDGTPTHGQRFVITLDAAFAAAHQQYEQTLIASIQISL